MSINVIYYLRCDGCAAVFRETSLFTDELRAVADAQGWRRSDWQNWMVCEQTPTLVDLCPDCRKRVVL